MVITKSLEALKQMVHIIIKRALQENSLILLREKNMTPEMVQKAQLLILITQTARMHLEYILQISPLNILPQVNQAMESLNYYQ